MVLCGMGMTGYSRTVVKPSAKVEKTSFAVITDTPTWQACGTDIRNYADCLTQEGLPAFIVYDNWKNPEQVKQAIADLYKKQKLEGVVFVGDIPVPMIRKAQHLTSAFKMDEQAFPMNESSVPSDRYYDDFDLKFDYIGRDSVNSSFYYYNLAVDSPQQIKCDIYSGRIRGVGEGEDHYRQISDFLRKAVAQHRETNKLDQFFSYTGEGSYSNSLTAWSAESRILRQQMPGTFDSPVEPGRARFMRYNFSSYPKKDVMQMLHRPDLDLTIFHEHGLPHRQYISGIPETEDMANHSMVLKESMRALMRRASTPERRAELEERYAGLGLEPAWWEGFDSPETIAADSLTDLRRGIVLEDVFGMAPNSRMVIFDACYNGDFREPDYIAGRYIMAPGKTVATFANSVNVLQDKQANELLGLLWLGARVGQWAQLTNILESHITGDPTFRFTPSYPGIDGYEMLRMPYDAESQLKMLESPLCDVRSAALHRLWANGYPGMSDILLEVYRRSDADMERFTCMHLLEQINDENYRKLLPEAINDSYEFIRRRAVSRMGDVGDDSYVPLLVKAYDSDSHAARVVFNILRSMQSFNTGAVEKALEGDTTAMAASLLKAHSQQANANGTILDRNASPKWRRLYINSLRNVPVQSTVKEYLALAEDPGEDEDIRLTMLGALAWYRLSVHAPEIKEACSRIMKSSTASKALKNEARRTFNRL